MEKKVTVTFEQQQENGQSVQVLVTLSDTKDGGTKIKNEFKPNLEEVAETEAFAVFNIFLEALRSSE